MTSVTDHTTASTNPNQALWEKGDFTRIAETMRESGEAVVRGFGDLTGLAVLDLGCGDGTTAVPAAQLGARVVGVDIARNLVAAGNARAEALGLTNCTFREGDACDLHDLDDERVRRGRKERQGGDSPTGARGTVRAREQKPGKRRHVHSRNVSDGYGGRLSARGVVDVVHAGVEAAFVGSTPRTTL